MINDNEWHWLAWCLTLETLDYGAVEPTELPWLLRVSLLRAARIPGLGPSFWVHVQLVQSFKMTYIWCCPIEFCYRFSQFHYAQDLKKSSNMLCILYNIHIYIYIPYHYINLNKGILLTIARFTDPKKMWSFKICIDRNEPRGRCPGVVGRPVAWLVGWFNHCCCLDPCR